MDKKRPVKKKSSLADFLWKDKKRRAKNIYFILMFFIAVVSVAMGYFNSKLELIDYHEEQTTTEIVEESTEPIVYEEEELALINANSNASTYNSYIYQWANNGGELYSSKNVINVLLVGLDSAQALEKGGRSDTLILISLNKKTQKINMTSFFRDTWTYMNVDGSDRYDKINSSYMYGGSQGLIDTIEKNFKVDIDYYVAVDFSSFTDIILRICGLISAKRYPSVYSAILCSAL